MKSGRIGIRPFDQRLVAPHPDSPDPGELRRHAPDAGIEDELAHRLIGSQCDYRLGDPYVRDLAPLPRQAKLFVLLFPLAVTWGLAAILLIAMFITLFYFFLPSGLAFQSYWFSLLIWISLAGLCLLYGGTATRDLIAAYWLLRGVNVSGYAADQRMDSAHTIH